MRSFRLVKCQSWVIRGVWSPCGTRKYYSKGEGGDKEGSLNSDPGVDLKRKPSSTVKRPSVVTQTVPREGKETSSVQGVALSTATTVAPSAVRKGQKGKQYSFLSNPAARETGVYDYTGQSTRLPPNATPKKALPAWASSLTHPSLRTRRMAEGNWVTGSDPGHTVSDTDPLVKEFKEWMVRMAGEGEEEDDGGAVLRQQLEDNVRLELRLPYQRGVYAKRRFEKGEVVLEVPVPNTENVKEDKANRSLGLSVNSETLRLFSKAVAQHPLPSFQTVREVLLDYARHRASSFEPEPHLLFIDLVYSALLLSCEKGLGKESVYDPYFRLLDYPSRIGSPGTAEGVIIDDDTVKDLHRGVLDPATHLELNDHINRFQHYLRLILQSCWEHYEAEVERERGEWEAGLPLSRLEKEKAQRAVKAQKAVSFEEKVHEACNKFYPKSVLAHPEDKMKETLELQWRSREEEEVKKAEAASTPTVSIEKKEREEELQEAFVSSLRPPPSFEDFQYCFRLLLSRSKFLPELRRAGLDACFYEESSEAHPDGAAYRPKEEFDAFGNFILQQRQNVYQHVFHALDESIVQRNHNFKARDSLTLVPLVDLLSAPLNGNPSVSLRVVERAENAPSSTTTDTVEGERGSDTRTDSSRAPPSKTETPRQLYVQVVAETPLEELDELTVKFPKQYSLSYTLYRFGFLPLQRREAETAEVLERYASVLRKEGGVWTRLKRRLLGEKEE